MEGVGWLPIVRCTREHQALWPVLLSVMNLCGAYRGVLKRLRSGCSAVVMGFGAFNRMQWLQAILAVSRL
jgi:hypothetical protein